MKFRNLDLKPSFAEQYKTTFTIFILELLNFVPSLISAITSATLYVWTDTIQSFTSTLQPLLVLIVLKGIMNDHMEEKYNYGTGRVECISSVATNVLNVTCLAIAFVVAILNIITPTQPSAGIAAFIVLKIVNCTGDVIFVRKEVKINRETPSTLNQTALKLQQQELYYDLAVLLVGIPCFFFRSLRWSWYISPITSIVICIYFIFIRTKQTSRFIRELSDAAIPVTEQIRIFDIVLDNSGAVVKHINSVNTRVLDQTVYVDIDVDFKDDITCGEEETWLRKVTKEILRASESNFRISLVHRGKE